MTKLLVTIVCLISLFHSRAFALKEYIEKKTVAKDAKRWSLDEWLQQKSKIKWSDMWLQYNSPSPYEFYFGADTSSYTSSIETNSNALTETTYRSFRGELGAFASIVGLKGNFEYTSDDTTTWQALLQFRLLGSYDQGTNLSIFYGLRGYNRSGESVLNQMGGGTMTMYLFQKFGLMGNYAYIIEADSDQQNRVSGFRWEAGAFIEYFALRLYGFYYQDYEKFEQSISYRKEDRRGIQFGLRFYF